MVVWDIVIFEPQFFMLRAGSSLQFFWDFRLWAALGRMWAGGPNLGLDSSLVWDSERDFVV